MFSYVVLLAFLSASMATSLSVTSCARFDNTQPTSAVGIGHCGAACGDAAEEECVATSYEQFPPGSSVEAEPTAQVRWGMAPPDTPSNQAGFGFVPATGSFNVDAQAEYPLFACGELQHYNYPIASGASSTDMKIDIEFGGESTLLDLTFNIEETPNQPPCDYQTAPDATPCADAITILNGGIDISAPTISLDIGRIVYPQTNSTASTTAEATSTQAASSTTGDANSTTTDVPTPAPTPLPGTPVGVEEFLVQLVGFAASADTIDVNEQGLISQEQRTNRAALVCRLIPPCPETCEGDAVPRDVFKADGTKVCGCVDEQVISTTSFFDFQTAPPTPSPPPSQCSMVSGDNNACAAMASCCWCSCNGDSNAQEFCSATAADVVGCALAASLEGTVTCSVQCAEQAPTPAPTTAPSTMQGGETTTGANGGGSGATTTGGPNSVTTTAAGPEVDDPGANSAASLVANVAVTLLAATMSQM